MPRIEIIILAPLIAALLISLVPPLDIRTRSAMSMVFQLGWLGLIIFLGIQGSLGRVHCGLLLAQTLVTAGVRFRKNTPSLLPPMSWLLTGIATAAILTPDLSLLLILAYLHIAFLLFVTSQTGGIYKGSATYESFLFFVTIDLAAYFSISLPYLWTYWILILPGLARILFPLTAPYARSLFVNCPTEIMLLMLSGAVPVGIAWLLRIPLPCPYLELLEILSFGSSFFAAILFLIEKSRRQRAIYLFMTQSALCARLILGSGSLHVQLFAGLLCLVALANTALWLYLIDYPRVRILNTTLAAATLFLLVYRP